MPTEDQDERYRRRAILATRVTVAAAFAYAVIDVARQAAQ